MSGYYNDDYDNRRRGPRRPVYEEDVVETRRSARAPPPRQMDLVRRRDHSEDSVEDIRRDFPPGSGGYVERRRVYRDVYPPAPQRARSVGRGGYEDTYYRDDRKSRRSGRSRRDYSDSESSVSPPPRNRERRKSISEQALAALGLGGAAAALTGKDSRDKDRARSRSRGGRDRRRGHSSSRSRSRSRSRDGKEKYAQAAKAAVTAGVIEAWRSRKEPGGWQGQGKRIATAAIGAAGINKAIDKNPEKNSTRHIVEGALGGLAGNRLINGSRSRSRSRARGKDEKSGPGLGGVAAAGGLAALAGQALNSYRERKRDDSRGRSRSRPRGGGGYSEDEYEDSRPKSGRRKSFSEKIYGGMDRGLAKFGLGESENHHPDYYIDKNGRRQNLDREVARPRGGGAEENAKKHGSDTDSYSSEEEQKASKKMYRKELITAGLASVATIHAAHNVYQSMEKREARHKQVMEGKMTPEEARRLKSKALLQDAASVGIAALGLKGAMSEWKEMKEQRGEYKEHQKRLEEKREHRRAKIEAGEWDPVQRRAIKKNSEPNMGDRYRNDYDDGYGYEDRYYDSPRYQDGNPYATGGLPPPPMGNVPLRY